MQTPLKYFSSVLVICLILALCMQKLDRTFTWLFSRHQTKITASLFSNNLNYLLIQGLHISVQGCGSHTALSNSPAGISSVRRYLPRASISSLKLRLQSLKTAALLSPLQMPLKSPAASNHSFS